MPLQQYPDPGAGVGAQANQPPLPDAQQVQPVPLPSHPQITSIDQIFNLEAVQSLTLHNDHPVSRLTYVFISKIMSESSDRHNAGDPPLTNRHLDSFLEQSIHFLNNLDVDDVKQLVLIMYGEWTPPQAVVAEHITGVRDRLGLSRDALLKNDPQLCMSVLYNHKIEYESLQFWQADNDGHTVNDGDVFGVTANTTATTPFLMLDTAFAEDRFLCDPILPLNAYTPRLPGVEMRLTGF